MKYIVSLVCGFIFINTTHAQQKWNLQSIVTYAMQNNLNVRITDLQTENARLTYDQSKLSRYPTASFGSNVAVNSGNNQDPTTFARVTQTYLSSNYNLQTSVDIFNWYSKKNTILANEWEVKAATANVDKLKNDIALNAANLYLQILLAMEQQKIAAVQIQQTQAQLNNTNKLVKAGSLPIINSTQLDAQLALDSLNYIQAKGNVTQSVLGLKAALSMDAGLPFEVETPDVSTIPLETIADLQPEYVYELALQNQPLQKFNEYKLLAAERSTAAAKGNMYPRFSAFAGLGSNFLAFKRRPFYDQVLSGFTPTALKVDVAGTSYSVQQPIFTQGNLLGYVKPRPFTTQLVDNFNQFVGISMNINIFNGGTARTSYKRSILNESTFKLQQERDDLQLKQDIYNAYTAATIALEKLNASKKSISSNEITYDFAQKRFNVGMLGTFDLITTQNNLLRAKLEYALNQFDYVFKMKVLEFYKGMGLKL